MKIFFGVMLLISAILNFTQGILFYKGKVEIDKRNILFTYICLAIFVFLAGLELLVK